MRNKVAIFGLLAFLCAGCGRVTQTTAPAVSTSAQAPVVTDPCNAGMSVSPASSKTQPRACPPAP